MNSEYLKFEAQVHKASQILALTAINFGDAQEDDSHTTVGWNEGENLLKGLSVNIQGRELWFAINVHEWKLIHFEGDQEMKSVFFEGMSWDELHTEWQGWISALGAEASKALHYDLPDSGNYKFTVFEDFDVRLIQEWKSNRSTANRVFKDLVDWSGVDSPIRIWPHHFDTGGYFVLDQDDNGPRASIGIGLAVADSMIDEPYYYIYGWIRDEAIDFSKAPVLGNVRWLNSDWKGAVLTVSSLTNHSEELNNFYH